MTGQLRRLFCRLLPEQPEKLFWSDFKSERRSGDRVQHPKRVQVFHHHPECPNARPVISQGLMKNFSADGCKLFVQGDIAVNTLWVRVVGRDPQEEFIECHVVWKGEAPSGAMQPCGVQFMRTMSREEFEGILAIRTHAMSA